MPARDEEELIGAAIEALAYQRGVQAGDFELIVVLDVCADDTEGQVERAASRHPHLRITLLHGPGGGAGPARRVGMDAAYDRLEGAGLIACTDADSTVASDWVGAQLRAMALGAHAIGGRIELHPADRDRLGPDVMADRAARQAARHQRVTADPGPPGSTAEHWQFSGASLAVTAKTYLRVGGMVPAAALEDEAFESTLIRHGVPIHRSLAVQVTTSGRLVGRAEAGLAKDLAAAAVRRG